MYWQGDDIFKSCIDEGKISDTFEYQQITRLISCGENSSYKQRPYFVLNPNLHL